MDCKAPQPHPGLISTW